MSAVITSVTLVRHCNNTTMKTTNLILLSALLIASCKKEAPEPSPSPTPVVVNSQLYGDWALRERAIIVNDSTTVTNYYNSPATCHLFFDTTAIATNPGYRNCMAAHLYCLEVPREWKIENDIILMSGLQYTVVFISSDSLVISESNKTYYLNR